MAKYKELRERVRQNLRLKSEVDLEVPVWLQVHDLDDLKSKLIGVVVAIIAVIFVGVYVDSNRASDVISYGVGAGALVVGLAFFSYATRKDSSQKPSKKGRIEQV